MKDDEPFKLKDRQRKLRGKKGRRKRRGIQKI